MQSNGKQNGEEKIVVQDDRVPPFRLIVALLIVGLVIVSEMARAEGSNEACQFLSGVKQVNCNELFSQIPNHNALVYSLKFFELNRGQLADSSCVRGSKQIVARNGIRNQCQFVITDVSARIPGYNKRAQSYLVNLCATSGEKVVTKFMTNLGTGSGFSDRNGAHTTSVGAFLTESHTRDFSPFKESDGYRKIRRQFNGRIPALNLIGLHSSNNSTDDGKPMHVSPYQSSWGCPSVEPKDVGVLRTLAAGGPSLVIHYASPALNPISSVNKCDAAGKSTAPSRDPSWVQTKNGRRTVHHVHRTQHHRNNDPEDTGVAR